LRFCPALGKVIKIKNHKDSIEMKRLVLVLTALTLLSACATQTRESEKKIRESADYWQRADGASSIYLTGPKAQHELHKDIAACVAEVKELVRLGSIRKAEPPRDLALEPNLKRGWASPTRDGPLFTEYTSFQDFDGCMAYKGWERVDYVKRTVADRAASTYSETILGHALGWSAPTATGNGATAGFND